MTNRRRKKHKRLSDCLSDKDKAFSTFNDDGSGYCHHCRQWFEDVAERSRHSRKSTMEAPNAE